MSNPEHFRSRAALYRQLAQNAKEERRAGDMFEIANLFTSMADELTLRMRPKPQQPKRKPAVFLLAIVTRAFQSRGHTRTRQPQ